jgi:hypothetical protein
LIGIDVSHIAFLFTKRFGIYLFKLFLYLWQAKSSEFSSTVEVIFIDIEIKRRKYKIPITLEYPIKFVEHLAIFRKPLNFLCFFIIYGLQRQSLLRIVLLFNKFKLLLINVVNVNTLTGSFFNQHFGKLFFFDPQFLIEVKSFALISQKLQIPFKLLDF